MLLESIAEFLKSNIFSISALFVSLFALSITVLNYLETRAKINVKQITTDESSFLIKPDRESTTIPDVYWHSAYRVISDVVITNFSSKPITIVEFRLNDKFTFNSYTKPGDSYSATLQLPEFIHNGVIINQKSETKHFPILDNWLKPIITIPPHTAIRGYLFFNIGNEKSGVQIGKNNLIIFTSRRTFKTSLEIFQEHMSVLVPESQSGQDTSQTY